MSYYLINKMFMYCGYLIIGLISFSIFCKNLKNKLKNFYFLYYATLFVLFVISSNLSFYFREKQLLEDFESFETDFFALHEINEQFIQKYLMNFPVPIKSELMSKFDPMYTIFRASFETYSKKTNRSPLEIQENYMDYVKATNLEIKEKLENAKEFILPLYNKYKLPVLNNGEHTEISVDKNGNIIPILKNSKGQITDLLFYDKNYNLIPFKFFENHEVKFESILENKNIHFKEIVSIYYLDSNNVRIPIEYYSNNIDTIPYYIDLQTNKDNFLKLIKIKKEYNLYLEKKQQLQDLIKNDRLYDFENFLQENKNSFSLNTILSNGKPIFTYAISLKSKNIINHFLTKEFDINLTDQDSKTALHNAIIQGYKLKFIKSLIQKGANINIRDADLKLPIDYSEKDNEIYTYLNHLEQI